MPACYPQTGKVVGQSFQPATSDRRGKAFSKLDKMWPMEISAKPKEPVDNWNYLHVGMLCNQHCIAANAKQYKNGSQTSFETASGRPPSRAWKLRETRIHGGWRSPATDVSLKYRYEKPEMRKQTVSKSPPALRQLPDLWRPQIIA